MVVPYFSSVSEGIKPLLSMLCQPIQILLTSQPWMRSLPWKLDFRRRRTNMSCCAEETVLRVVVVVVGSHILEVIFSELDLCWRLIPVLCVVFGSLHNFHISSAFLLIIGQGT